MKLLTITLLLFSFSLTAQESVSDIFGTEEIIFLEFKSKISAKLVKKRFDKAVIHKDIFENDDFFFILYEENDEHEYFDLLGIKIYCLPKKLRNELLLEKRQG